MSEKRKRAATGELENNREGAFAKIKDEPDNGEKKSLTSSDGTKMTQTTVDNNDDTCDDDSDSDSEEDDGEMDVDALKDDTDQEDNEYNNAIVFEAGMILEVYMENFMNHRKFSLKLGKVVNFVTGQNGSGKSACVAAIQLCLGATASKTGRASNMAKMIRHGSNGPAICRVTLLNKGDDAYKPDEYGSEIKVERRITRQGAATYHIFGEKCTKAISHNKLELERILQNFNIYVDNPCCILTQEQSKTFINGKEKEKYDFFLKATGLERIRDEIDDSRTMIETGHEAVMASKSTKLKKFNAMQELQNTVNALRALDKHQDEIQGCLAKIFWCDVEEAQKVVEEIEVKKVMHDKNLQKAEAHLLAQEQEKDNIGSVDAVSEVIQELVDQQKELEIEHAGVVKTYKDKTFHENECKTVVQQLKNTLGQYQQRLAATRQEIAELQAASMKDAAAVEKLVLDKIATCRDSLKQSEADGASAMDRSRGTKQELDEIKTSLGQLTRQRDHTQRALSDSQRELNSMQKDGGSGRLNRFHNNMSKVVGEMKNTAFQSDVCGPLGMEILLKDEFKQLGSAVEKSLWHSLSSFVVDNVADRTKLSAILRRNGLQTSSQIYMQSKRPRYDVRLHREVANTIFVCDTIHVESDTVFNALVDQSRIDQVIITQTERESDERFITTVNGQRQFLAGIKQAVTMDGRTISYKRGNKSSEQTNYPYKKLLAADTTEIIANLGISIRRDEEEIAGVREEIQKIAGNVSLLENQRKQDESNVFRISQDVQRNRKLLSDLQNEYSDIQTSNSAGQSDFASLEAEAVELTDAISEVERRMEAAVSDVNAAKQELRDCLAEKRRVESRRKKLKAEQNNQEGLIEDHINLLQGLSREVDKASREVLKFQKFVVDIDHIISTKQGVVDEKTEIARLRTPEHIQDWDGNPIKLDRKDSRSNLSKRINHLKGQIEEGKKKAGLEGYTLDILTDRMSKATNDFLKFREEYSEVKKRINNMEKDLKVREKLWESQVSNYSRMVSREFDTYMQKRGFSGNVVFDHDAKSLDVRSQTDNANLTTRCTDLRQMSGGERSYTALCLLLALGHVIECPFRLMDEYDVFLDQMARKLTLDILAEYAKGKEQQGRQFIIITPQDLKHMKTSNEVRIHKMPDPERIHTGVAQQQTLDF